MPFGFAGGCEPSGALSSVPGSSRRILYKWLERYRRDGVAGLSDHSRRPLHSPCRTAPELEAAVLEVRRENRVWGGRKIAATLARQGVLPPSPSTITAILRRNAVPLVAPGQKAWKRFEHVEPNVLWQMDFKGEVAMARGQLHPLTIVDDHSRFSVGLQAADNQRHGTVQDALQAAFERYGLPLLMLTDNGSPWGDTGQGSLTRLGVWLIEHGVAPLHSAPYHPQSHGKNERFNRTLNAELLDGRTFADLAAGPACLRRLAPPLQPSSPTRRPEPRGAGRSLPPQPALVQHQGSSRSSTAPTTFCAGSTAPPGSASAEDA